MPPDPSADFLAAVARTGLLPAADLAALKAWATAETADASAVAKELLRRNLLTPWQIIEIYRGRGADLTVGPYLLLDLLGEGGMGRVYRAKHTRLHRDVALKVIRKEKLSNPLTVQRFHQEVRAVAQMSHPNVVLAFDADQIGDTHFFAMEYIDGQDLTKIVQARGALPVAEACEYVRQAALGLQHAFERGLVHRDVKPSNLLAAKGGQVKVLDLGLAMLNDLGEDRSRVTQDGFVIGTPDFLAPEQAKDPLTVDTRADVYALGATLFYLLTARVPYEGATATEKLVKHISDPPPSLRAVVPALPPQLDAVVQWMMAKRPEDRPQTPAHAAAALAPFGPGGTGTYPVPAAPRPAPAFDPHSSAVVFKVGAGRVVAPRARPHSTAGRGLAVAAVAVTAAGVIAFLLYKMATTAPAPAVLGDTFTIDRIGLKMVRVMGTDAALLGAADTEPGRGPDDQLPAAVPIPGPFYIGATEVTGGQYAVLIGKNPAAGGGKVAGKLSVDLPVESVTHDEAVEFCRKLTEYDKARTPGWAYRLPTEAEWEYAARGGTATPFPNGEKLKPGEDAVFAAGDADPLADGAPNRAPELPAKVGGTRTNGFGLFDVSGNVAEWCAGSFGPKPAWKPVRGGSFADPAAACRAAARRGLPGDTKSPQVGFRVVFAPQP